MAHRSHATLRRTREIKIIGCGADAPNSRMIHVSDTRITPHGDIRKGHREARERTQKRQSSDDGGPAAFRSAVKGERREVK